MWGRLGSLGSQARNAFGSFSVRSPKIAFPSTKTDSNNKSTFTPAFQHRVSLAIACEPSAPSSCATARDQLTKGNKHRRPPLHPSDKIVDEEDSLFLFPVVYFHQ